MVNPIEKYIVDSSQVEKIVNIFILVAHKLQLDGGFAWDIHLNSHVDVRYSFEINPQVCYSYPISIRIKNQTNSSYLDTLYSITLRPTNDVNKLHDLGYRVDFAITTELVSNKVSYTLYMIELRNLEHNIPYHTSSPFSLEDLQDGTKIQNFAYNIFNNRLDIVSDLFEAP